MQLFPSFKSIMEKAQAAEASYLQNSDIEALEEAINYWEYILNKPSFAHADKELRLKVLNNSAITYQNRYWAKDDLVDLNRALDNWRYAIEQTPYSYDLAIYLNNLGNGLRDRYTATGEFEDLYQSIKICEQAVQQTADDAQNLPMYLSNLANAVSDSYYESGNFEDLQRAIAIYEQAVQKTPPDSPDLPMWLNNLGIALNDRYNYTDSLTDLQHAIEIFGQAVQETPPNAPQLPIYLNALGSGLTDRYEHTGQIEDLETAIEAFEQASAKVSTEAPDALYYLNNLGNVLRERYEHSGDIEDLRQAIEASEQSVEKTTENASSLPSRVNNLGGCLREHYLRTNQLADLEKVIIAFEQAIEKTPTNSPDLVGILNNLATSLSDRYIHTHDVTELQKAIEIWKQIVQTNPESPYLSLHLNNLGTGLHDWYGYTNKLIDLQAAIDILKQAVSKASPHSADLFRSLNNFANVLRDLYDHTQAPEDLQLTIETYEQAVKAASNISVKEELMMSLNWLHWAFYCENWKSIEQAYHYAYPASEKLFQTQLLRHNKEIWLKDTQNLAAQAAYALAKNNKLQYAVVALETGLARLLSEALARDRADLEQLKTTGHAELYDRYQQIVEKWHSLTQQSEINKDALRATHNELDATISAIQQIQGFEQFLKPPTFTTIQQAAQDTTLIYILATEAGGLALLVGEKIIPVWLPALIDTDLHNILNNEDQTGYLDIYFNRKKNQKAWYTALDTTTSWLWQTVMAPIIDALPPQAKVTLIPVGLLGLLPLHAAWTKTTDTPNNRLYVLDVLNIHYSPNARTLTEARLIAERITPDTLLTVDEPLPVHAAEPLPHSTHEVQSIISHFPKFHQFQHQNATREAILNALPHCTVLHFSCHGLAQLDNPLSSGLVMACLDDNKEQFITLADVLNLRLTGVRLATLSACETNISGTTLPDEVVNFSAGLLQAGVAGVIASLWSVEGLSTLMLMTYFYELWQTEQLEPIEALRQAQRWMKNSTNQEKVDYVKARFPKEVYKKLRNEIGFSPVDENNFAHPYYWGAFEVVGI